MPPPSFPAVQAVVTSRRQLGRAMTAENYSTAFVMIRHHMQECARQKQHAVKKTVAYAKIGKYSNMVTQTTCYRH